MSFPEVPFITVNGSPIAGTPADQSTSPQPQISSSASTYSKSEYEAYRTTLPKGGSPAFDFTYEKFDYNLIVYHYQGVGVLVQAVSTYEEAVDIAVKEFPSLANCPREDITLCYETASYGKTAHWRISESAWANSARKFQPRTKLHIAVRGQDKMAGPSLTNNRNPPPYESSGDEKTRARSESPRGLKSHPPVAKVKSGSSISSLFKRL